MANTKNLRSVAALTPMALGLATQNVVSAPPRPAPRSSAEPVEQFSFALRKSRCQQLMRLADDADMTMRACTLEALKAKGLEVTQANLLDPRKRG